jgi:hypothetical protein
LNHWVMTLRSLFLHLHSADIAPLQAPNPPSP